MNREYSFEEKGEIRTAYDAGICAIGVPDGVIHPECRTDQEMMWTVRFYKEDDPVIQGRDCVRCGVRLDMLPANLDSDDG